MPITLEHVGITTTKEKFSATVAFYGQIFGLKPVREGKDLVFLSDGQGGRIEIMAYGDPALPSPNHLAFGVPPDQFGQTVAALEAAGAHVEPPGTTAAGDRLCYFNDPAGNRAQIVGRKNPLPL
ncbi:MAG: VOC family protein [Chloroflexi bacterium]|nr:VOC family protein [Chloroflexota bacterium]